MIAFTEATPPDNPELLGIALFIVNAILCAVAWGVAAWRWVQLRRESRRDES